MVDLPRPAHGDQRGQLVAGGVEGVDAQVARARRRPASAAGVGEVAQRAGRQVVDDVDGLALGDQPLDEVGADEPGAADDEDPALGRRRAPAAPAARARRRSSVTGSAGRFGDPGVGVVLTVGNDGVGADHGANEPWLRDRPSRPRSTPRRRRRRRSRRRATAPIRVTEAPGADRGRRHRSTLPTTEASAPTVGAGATPRRLPRSRRAPVDQVEVGLQVQLGAAGVDPVVVGGQRVEAAAGGDQPGTSPARSTPAARSGCGRARSARARTSRR